MAGQKDYRWLALQQYPAGFPGLWKNRGWHATLLRLEVSEYT